MTVQVMTADREREMRQWLKAKFRVGDEQMPDVMNALRRDLWENHGDRFPRVEALLAPTAISLGLYGVVNE